MDEDSLYCKYVRIIREATDSLVSLKSPDSLSFTTWRGMVEEMCGGHWTIHCFSTEKHRYYPNENRYETDSD